MRLIAERSLRDYWQAHPETRIALRLWVEVVRAADWDSMSDVQARWPKAKVLNGERVRFQIAGGDYRLVASFYFQARSVWVKFVGTHTQYDRIDALTVDMF